MKSEPKDEVKRSAGLKPYQERLTLQKNGREYRAICPWHSDHNPSLTIFKKNGEWLFKCFGPDGSAGDVIEFVMKRDALSFKEALQMIANNGAVKLDDVSEKTGIRFDKSKATGALIDSSEALEYLETRGISKEEAVSRGLGLFDFPGTGPCIAIPYASGAVKFRAIHPKDKDQKFRSLGTPNSRLYGIELVDDIFFPPTKLLIVESELDQITTSKHLYSTDFAVVSVSSATGSLRDGELQIDEKELSKVKNFDGKIFIATDQDTAGNLWAEAALKVLPPYKTCRVTWSGAKDIGELFTKLGAGFADEIRRLCDESFIPLLWRKASPFATLAEKKFEWVVQDLIPADGITVVTGDFGSFKSYISYFLADAISEGGVFVDRRCQKHPVLILDRENSHSTVYRRRSLVGGLKHKDNVRILGLFTDPPAPEITKSELLAVCGRVKPVVIIDSLTDFHPGLRESDPDDMTKCFSGIRDLVTKGAFAVIVLHHVPKKGRGRGGNYRGSTSIPAAGTSALLIEKEGKNLAKITGFKARDGVDQKIVLKLDFGVDAVSYQVIESGRDPDADLKDRIEEHIQKHDGCSKNTVSKALGGRKQKVLQLIDEMVQVGKIFCSGKRNDARLHCNQQLVLETVGSE